VLEGGSCKGSGAEGSADCSAHGGAQCRREGHETEGEALVSEGSADCSVKDVATRSGDKVEQAAQRLAALIPPPRHAYSSERQGEKEGFAISCEGFEQRSTAPCSLC